MARRIIVECDTFADLGRFMDKHVLHDGFSSESTEAKCAECGARAFLQL